MSAMNRPFALIRAVRSERGTASRSLCSMERNAPDAAGPASPRARAPPRPTSCSTSQPASIARRVSKERVVALPDHTIPVLGSKIDAVQLLDDVLHLVGDESRDLWRRPKVGSVALTRVPPSNVKAVRASTPAVGRGRSSGRTRTRNVRAAPNPGNLAPKGRRPLTHVLDHDLEQRIHVEVRWQGCFRPAGDDEVGPGCNRAGSE